MSIRMGPRLSFALQLPRELENEPVPTLLLQPLVENSVLHGLEGQVAGGRVTVSARRDGERRACSTSSTPASASAPADAQAGAGFGLAQTRERLATLYGAAARVELGPGAGRRRPRHGRASRASA